MACNFSDYCLGMCEWTDCPGEKENETSATSREQRFTEFVSDDKLADLAKGFVPDIYREKHSVGVKELRPLEESKKHVSARGFCSSKLLPMYRPKTIKPSLFTLCTGNAKVERRALPPCYSPPLALWPAETF